MNHIQMLEVLFLGGFAGILSTFLGLGGGVLFVSFLPLIFGIEQVVAIGTSLATVFLINCVNVIKFHKQGLIRWKVAGVIASTAAIAGFLAGRFAQGVSEKVLIGILATCLLLLGIWTFFKKEYTQKNHEPKRWPMLLMGAFSGSISGMTGIGAGAINGAFLLNMGIVKRKEMSPTSNAIMIPTTMMGAMSYFSTDFGWPRSGNVQINLVLGLFISAFLFAQLGYRFQHKMPDRWRRVALLSLFIVLTTKELVRFFRY
ncbi:MAG: sulfite exporter TauE/SafE family protein [Bdellovibrionales bacterium]|nr:sulfite exporter TauE/SafE family protein [Bdellovibrionales bacterium]